MIAAACPVGSSDALLSINICFHAKVEKKNGSVSVEKDVRSETAITKAYSSNIRKEI